jgi:hypothetical protein
MLLGSWQSGLNRIVLHCIPIVGYVVTWQMYFGRRGDECRRQIKWGGRIKGKPAATCRHMQPDGAG